jgi:hypothetical protein
VQDHFVLLLALLVADLIVSAFSESGIGRLVTVLIYVATAVVAFRATTLRAFPRAFLVVAFGLVALLAVAMAPLDNDLAQTTGAASAALIIAGTLASVLGRVLQHERVTVQTIAGAVCSYLLIGFLFSMIYASLDHVGSGQVFGRAVDPDEYAYFSFVTLTTVGFGDLTPVTTIAQRLAIIEAMAGQILLVTMIARLVSLFEPKAKRPS